jgi:HEPN domain-containing protein
MDGATRTRDECQNCGASLDPSETGPCPSCGQLAGKKVYVTAMARSRSVATASASVKKWRERYEVLLDTAKLLREQEHYEAAIVMAQTACEVCTEAVLTGALRERVKDDDVADLITDSLNSYSLKNNRVQKRYEVLFGHRIQDQPFWQPLEKHVTRRHGVVHRGEEATPKEADESIAAVEKTIRHLLQVQG